MYIYIHIYIYILLKNRDIGHKTTPASHQRWGPEDDCRVKLVRMWS